MFGAYILTTTSWPMSSYVVGIGCCASVRAAFFVYIVTMMKHETCKIRTNTFRLTPYYMQMIFYEMLKARTKKKAANDERKLKFVQFHFRWFIIYCQLSWFEFFSVGLWTFGKSEQKGTAKDAIFFYYLLVVNELNMLLWWCYWTIYSSLAISLIHPIFIMGLSSSCYE